MLALVAAAALCGAALATECLPAAEIKRLDTGRLPLTINTNDWTASRLDYHVARILVEEAMGLPVQQDFSAENDFWARMAALEIDVNLEVWPSGHQGRIDQYVNKEWTVQVVKSLGPVAGIGWYVSRWTLDEKPDLVSWQGFLDPEAAVVFGGELGANGTVVRKGSFVGAAAEWTAWDAAVVDALGLQVEVEVSADADEHSQEVLSRLQSRENFVGYLWTPHEYLGVFDLVRVALPQPTSECLALAFDERACDYPADTLLIAAHVDLDELHPESAALLRRFTLTTDDQIEMLTDVFVGLDPPDAACRWVLAHRDVWGAWVQDGLAARPPPERTDETLRVAAVGAGLVMGILLYAFLRAKHPNPNNHLVLLVSLGVLDWVVDAMLAHALYTSPEFEGPRFEAERIFAVALVVVPVCVNLVIIITYVRFLMQDAPDNREHFQEHEGLTSVTLMLSLLNPVALLLFVSGIGNIAAFDAPWTPSDWRWMATALLQPHFVEDFPQLLLAVRIAMRSEGVSEIALLAILVTTLVLVTAALRLLLRSVRPRVQPMGDDETTAAEASVIEDLGSMQLGSRKSRGSAMSRGRRRPSVFDQLYETNSAYVAPRAARADRSLLALRAQLDEALARAEAAEERCRVLEAQARPVLYDISE